MISFGSLFCDACSREHELLLMTMDESGDDCAPPVFTRFNVSDCSRPRPVVDDSSRPPSAWSILQQDVTFGAGWPSVFYTRLHANVDPLFTITPPPIETRMLYLMEGIFAAIVVPEYAQLMGVNLKSSSANQVAGSVSDFKYIPVTSSYLVTVVSSFLSLTSTSSLCPDSHSCMHKNDSFASAQQTCESNPHSVSGSRAVVTLITSDSYLHGALVLL